MAKLPKVIYLAYSLAIEFVQGKEKEREYRLKQIEEEMRYDHDYSIKTNFLPFVLIITGSLYVTCMIVYAYLNHRRDSPAEESLIEEGINQPSSDSLSYESSSFNDYQE